MKKRIGRIRGGDQHGQAAVEFALGLPLLLLLLMATVVFGIVFNNDLTLTAATTTGAQQLSISRGETSDPCNLVATTVEQAAPALKTANFTFSVAFGSGSPLVYGSPHTGTSCTSAAADLISGDTAQVTVTYPCNPSSPNIEILGYNPWPSCTLSAQTAELIQ
jgi:Flp pilus assembly protein TadG